MPPVPALVDAADALVRRANAAPAFVMPPLNPNGGGSADDAAWPGEGQYFWGRGRVPTINVITGPTYLLNYGRRDDRGEDRLCAPAPRNRGDDANAARSVTRAVLRIARGAAGHARGHTVTLALACRRAPTGAVSARHANGRTERPPARCTNEAGRHEAARSDTIGRRDDRAARIGAMHARRRTPPTHHACCGSPAASSCRLSSTLSSDSAPARSAPSAAR